MEAKIEGNVKRKQDHEIRIQGRMLSEVGHKRFDSMMQRASDSSYRDGWVTSGTGGHAIAYSGNWRHSVL